LGSTALVCMSWLGGELSALSYRSRSALLLYQLAQIDVTFFFIYVFEVQPPIVSCMQLRLAIIHLVRPVVEPLINLFYSVV